MIDVRDLRFRYDRAKQSAVSGLSFSVPDGEIFGFLGPSGAGKSTTQKILIGLLEGFEGEAAVLGQDLRRRGADFYERIGVSFEQPTLYLKLSALENLSNFASFYSVPTEDPRTLLERVGLANEADMRVSQFSKGMKVRLGFARALLNRPRLLFLDEPTAGLDPVNAGIVKNLVREARAGGATVFLTTHDMNAADQLCDRVAFLVEGSIRHIDAPRSLKQQYGSSLVRVEFGEDGELRSREFPLEGLAENADFLETLRKKEIETIHSQETTLEQVFIEVTGRSLS
jgi:fluoroquinolone transport system ATP-binding protein